MNNEGQVAPHEGREISLVLSGAKPIATIERSKDPLAYSVAVSIGAAGMVAYHVGPSEDDPTGEIAIAKHSNSGLIDEYKRLLSTGVAKYGIKEYHRRVGALFGYSKEDVEAFIASDIDCDCTKCAGVMASNLLPTV